MFQPPAQLFEDRSRPRRVRRFGAHQPDQLSLPRRTGRATHRTFDEGCALGAYRPSERGLSGRQNRAHVDE